MIESALEDHQHHPGHREFSMDLRTDMPGVNRRSRKARMCTACRQAIVPGEIYRMVDLPPWDGGGYAHWALCRWCGDHLGRFVDLEDGWSEDALRDGYEAMHRSWLTRLARDGPLAGLPALLAGGQDP